MISKYHGFVLELVEKKGKVSLFLANIYLFKVTIKVIDVLLNIFYTFF